MRATRFTSLVLAILSIPQLTVAQQTASSSTQASQLLQKSLAALQGNTSLNDVTLSGTARRIAGSDDETGTATFKGLAVTSSRVDLSLPSGARSEIRTVSKNCPVGSWIGPDGVSHPVANHNLSTDPGWFAAFTLASVLSAQNVVVTEIGTETRNGQSVIHLSTGLLTQGGGDVAKLAQHLSQTDIFLDANTLLPSAFTFNTHPDSNAFLDLPIEIRFSDYRSVNGIQIPFHVQKFLNNSLILDLQFQTAVLNTGLSAADFSVGAAL